MGSREGAESTSTESRVSSRAWPQSALPALEELLARAAAGLRGVGRRQGSGNQGEPKLSLRAASGRGPNPASLSGQRVAAPPQSHPQSPAPGSPAGPLRSLPSPGPAPWTWIPNLLSSSISRYLNYANLPPPYGPLPTLFFKVKGAQGFPDARTFARPSTFQSCPSGAQISPTASTLPLSPLVLTNPKATPSG